MTDNTPVQKELSIETHSLKKSALIFRAMNHQRRQNMLRLMHKKGEMTVTEIYTNMQLEQSIASQHLAILRNAGLVKTERDGKSIIYSVNYNRLQQIHQIAESLLNKNGQ
jgi:DNA-binding transcriptional ArsR family regulator